MYSISEKKYIGYKSGRTDKVFTTPNNCYYINFCSWTTYGGTYNNDICINLSHDGSRNGEYEPYVKHTYPLDSSLTLRGIPKLDSSNRLYYDGDSYASDGTVERRYGIVDLGTLNWTYDSSNSTFYTLELVAPYQYANFISVLYKMSAYTSIGSLENMAGQFRTNALYIKNTSYTDATTFKTAMSGVYFVYELAEPTTETAITYQNPQVVNDWGTEEYVDYAYTQGTRDVAVPVGHYTEYLPNLRNKLQALPDAAGSNGTYVIEQTGGQMALTPLTTPKEIPDVPTSTDGTFALQATVSSGNVTYAWVSAT